MAGGSEEEVTSRRADQMLAALALVIEIPEVQELHRNVKKFMQDRKEQVATNDLLHLMNLEHGSRVDSAKVRACLQNMGSWSPEADQLVAKFCQTILQDIVSKARFWPKLTPLESEHR